MAQGFAKAARDAGEPLRAASVVFRVTALAGHEDELAAVARAVGNALLAQTLDLPSQRLELAPAEGTLLHFLRQEHPRWSLDIAKVLRGDVLGRTDLAPALTEPEGALYGLSLNLERLDAHPASDVRSAELDVERAQMLLESPSRPALQRFLAGWQPLLHATRSQPEHKSVVRWLIDVDPLAI